MGEGKTTSKRRYAQDNFWRAGVEGAREDERGRLAQRRDGTAQSDKRAGVDGRMMQAAMADAAESAAGRERDACDRERGGKLWAVSSGGGRCRWVLRRGAAVSGLGLI